jgi:hypothetical protein
VIDRGDVIQALLERLSRETVQGLLSAEHPGNSIEIALSFVDSRSACPLKKLDFLPVDVARLDRTSDRDSWCGPVLIDLIE